METMLVEDVINAIVRFNFKLGAMTLDHVKGIRLMPGNALEEILADFPEHLHKVVTFYFQQTQKMEEIQRAGEQFAELCQGSQTIQTVN